MIKTQHGNTVIEGHAVDVLADFSTIVKNLNVCLKDAFEDEERVKNAIDFAYKNGFLTDEEIRNKAEKASKIIGSLADFLEAFGVDFDEDEEGGDEDGSAE